jgi:CheY-like chemotaxis protein
MSRPRRVVYIEDNAANLALVTKVLAHGGYDVLGAPTGEAGLELVAREKPDVVLLDLDLPGIDGFEVARRLKADRKLARIPIIAISASVMKHEREQALAVGCLCFVEKPFDIGALRVAVHEAVHGGSPDGV